ncbi:MAG: TIGR02757 family protein [Desulfobacterota bacterium]|nr:TIGR02757 family protein [Thermodesulfobacteriota bacterium]
MRFALSLNQIRTVLEDLYTRYNHPAFISPDPLQFLYRYDDPSDREVVGLICATLAYGRVAQIVKNIEKLLYRLGPSPTAMLCSAHDTCLQRLVSGIRHRFTGEREILALLCAIRDVVRYYGSLHRCFCTCLQAGERNVMPAIDRFVQLLGASYQELTRFTLPRPKSGSACKRINLFLRWMVRKDAVDLGDWHGVQPSFLIVPLDTHMFRIAHALRFTRRAQPDLGAALEITECFTKICPEDPVRYDFVLTRFGIREDFAGQECDWLFAPPIGTSSKMPRPQAADRR